MEKATSARPRNRPKFINALPAEGPGVIGADFRGPNIVVIAESLLTEVAPIALSICAGLYDRRFGSLIFREPDLPAQITLVHGLSGVLDFPQAFARV
jgi:hypothetical protein